MSMGHNGWNIRADGGRVQGSLAGRGRMGKEKRGGSESEKQRVGRKLRVKKDMKRHFFFFLSFSSLFLRRGSRFPRPVCPLLSEHRSIEHQWREGTACNACIH
ncbi:hypothetical protein LY78DRAFT_228714 [Colletotrichum sublineola]|nr:hypothetical protein LY78DRAFT_228714 [Colletotrichum sublineola]